MDVPFAERFGEPWRRRLVAALVLLAPAAGVLVARTALEERATEAIVRIEEPMVVPLRSRGGPVCRPSRARQTPPPQTRRAHPHPPRRAGSVKTASGGPARHWQWRRRPSSVGAVTRGCAGAQPGADWVCRDGAWAPWAGGATASSDGTSATANLNAATAAPSSNPASPTAGQPSAASGGMWLPASSSPASPSIASPPRHRQPVRRCQSENRSSPRHPLLPRQPASLLPGEEMTSAGGIAGQ